MASKRKPKKRKPRAIPIDSMVVVEWIDTCVNTNYWAKRDKAMAQMFPLEVTTVGFLFEDSKAHITIVSSKMPRSDEVGGTISIPKEAIRRIRTLRL